MCILHLEKYNKVLSKIHIVKKENSSSETQYNVTLEDMNRMYVNALKKDTQTFHRELVCFLVHTASKICLNFNIFFHCGLTYLFTLILVLVHKSIYNLNFKTLEGKMDPDKDQA